MTKFTWRVWLGFFAILIAASCADVLRAQPAQTAGGDRFEVAGIKAVRPTLVNTLNALKRGDVPAAKAAFADYDSAWNGIEVYISTRDRAMYGDIEQHWQATIGKELLAPNPDPAMIAGDVTMMLAKFDEAIAMVQNAPPLNPLYDDVARLRIVRSPLRGVNPALKAGDFDKARKLYSAFDDKWDSIEDLIKARNADSYTAIERNMIQIEQGLMPAKPDVDKVSTLVSDILDKYNAVVTQITTDARNQK